MVVTCIVLSSFGNVDFNLIVSRKKILESCLILCWIFSCFLVLCVWSETMLSNIENIHVSFLFLLKICIINDLYNFWMSYLGSSIPCSLSFISLVWSGKSPLSSNEKCSGQIVVSPQMLYIVGTVSEILIQEVSILSLFSRTT